MSEETVIESSADEATQKRALDMGWIGPDKFKGDPEKFIDAEAFIERAETFVPFLKKQRDELTAKLAAETAARSRLEGELGSLRESLDSIEERYTVETQKRVEAATRDLKEQIRIAAEENNVKAVVALTSELDDLREAERKALEDEAKEKTEAARKKAPAQTTTQISPEMQAEIDSWLSDHKWVETDKKKSAIFFGFMQARRADGDKSQGKAFFDAALADMEEALEKDSKPKVEGGKNGSGAGGGGSSGRGRSYEDLPKEAREACDKDAPKFVGKGKRYADAAAWRKSYADLYFSME